MANGTWEEAKACPRCGLTGEQGRAMRSLAAGRGVTRGARLVELTCRNNRCRWFNTSWEVQINPDGTIPDPSAPREKQFPKPDAALVAQVRANAERAYQESIRQGNEANGR